MDKKLTKDQESRLEGAEETAWDVAELLCELEQLYSKHELIFNFSIFEIDSNGRLATANKPQVALISKNNVHRLFKELKRSFVSATEEYVEHVKGGEK